MKLNDVINYLDALTVSATCMGRLKTRDQIRQAIELLKDVEKAFNDEEKRYNAPGSND